MEGRSHWNTDKHGLCPYTYDKISSIFVISNDFIVWVVENNVFYVIGMK